VTGGACFLAVRTNLYATLYPSFGDTYLDAYLPPAGYGLDYWLRALAGSLKARDARGNLVVAGGAPLKEATPEDRLMAQYAAGDDGAFQRLFALLAPRVRAFFVRSFSDSTVADDLMQTTFLKLHCARTSYRPELPLKPWVFTIAASVRRDELRRRYRLPPHVGEAELESAESGLGDPAPGPAAGALSSTDAVRAAIGHLPESQRVVLHLHCYEELTFEQIAGALGTTPGAVRVRASRAYERLREELRPYLRPAEIP
jgi:RNA polymerase sigma factor (sigma-70 family)